MQFRELRAVGLHFPSNEYGNRQWSGEVVDCEIALHPIPNKFGQPEQKRVIKVAGKVLSPLDIASPAFALGTNTKSCFNSVVILLLPSTPCLLPSLHDSLLR